jgi:CBS domain-containing protein
MEENEISSLVVLNDAGVLAGVVHLKDLLHAGIV